MGTRSLVQPPILIVDEIMLHCNELLTYFPYRDSVSARGTSIRSKPLTFEPQQL